MTEQEKQTKTEDIEKDIEKKDDKVEGTDISKVEELHTIISNLSNTIVNMTKEIETIKQAQQDYKAQDNKATDPDTTKSFLDWLNNNN